MSPRHLVGVVVTVALSSIAAATACGVDVSIESASDAGGGTSGTSGTSGASGTSGSSGASGSSGTSGTSGADGSTPDLLELTATAGMTAFAVGSGLIAFATTQGLGVCTAPDCPSKKAASGVPTGAATAIAYFAGTFYAIIGNHLRRCSPAGGSLDCSAELTSANELAGGTWLRVDNGSVVWRAGTNLYWTKNAISPVLPIYFVSGADLGGMALAADRLVFTSAGTSGSIWKVEQLLLAGTTGTPSGAVDTNLAGLYEPTAVALDATDMFIAVRSSTAGGGYVLQCPASEAGCKATSFNAAFGLVEPEGIAIDAKTLFVSERGADRVIQIPRGGSTATLVTGAIRKPSDIAVDGAYVWVAGISNSVPTLYRAKRKP